ncbi:MAG TPA: hypothetical protein VM533_00945 [Fimbriiglobus sp.]|nr:hypothetical protein [Fimbriiglobus sp.]
MRKLILATVVMMTTWATGCRMCCDDYPSRAYHPGPPPVVASPGAY